MTLPKIQVLLSTYNGEKYLRQQLDSVFAQREVDLKLLIRDDGSSDLTVDILKAYKHTYPEIVEFKQGDNKGAKGSFFELIAESSSEMDYYAFCDQDDIWKEEKLQRAVRKLTEAEELLATSHFDSRSVPLLYCSSTQMVDSDLSPFGIWPKKPVKKPALYNALVENIAVGCTMVMNRAAMDLVKAHLPKHIDRIIMHDWWIYAVVSSFGQIIFDEEPFILYRQHGGNVLGGQTEDLAQRWKRRFSHYRGEAFKNKFSGQAQEFYNCYGDLLSIEHEQAVQEFLSMLNQNLLSRSFYSLKMPFYRQSQLDNGVLKLIYILRRV